MQDGLGDQSKFKDNYQLAAYTAEEVQEISVLVMMRGD